MLTSVTRRLGNRQLGHTSMPIVQLEKVLKSTTGGTLDELVQRAEGLDRLMSGLKKVLDPTLALHLKGVNLRRDGQLVLVAESPAWAARLRFEADKLLAAAQDGGATVKSCKVIVAKDQPEKSGSDHD